MRPAYSSIRSSIRLPHSSLALHRSFSSRASLNLWNGTTQPYENLKVATPPPLNPQQPATAAAPSNTEKSIEQIHQKFVEDLLQRAAASAAGLDTQVASKSATKRSSDRRQRTRQHSLSEPPLFRTDGPLTPYPIELDSGEMLEPKHATLVRITDQAGEERNIVVAEVEEESGKQRRVLFAVDLDRYRTGNAVGQKITAEDTYAFLGLESQNVKP